MLTRKTICGALIVYSSAATVGAAADVVEATFRVQASDFQDSALQPPAGATTNSVDAVFTVTFNSAINEQIHLVPGSISGLDITDNNGAVTVYDASLAAVNTRRFAADDKIRLTAGGLLSSVEFMAGLSNDFRVRFDLSLNNYAVLDVAEAFTFVTPADPFYTAQNTTVTIEALTITPDSDADTLVDTQDNCIERPNADQRDTDADGIGNRCDADFNQDCVVNVIDLARMRQDFFAVGDLDTDLDGDGIVNVTDLGILRTLFFATPGPSGIANLCTP